MVPNSLRRIARIGGTPIHGAGLSQCRAVRVLGVAWRVRGACRVPNSLRIPLDAVGARAAWRAPRFGAFRDGVALQGAPAFAVAWPRGSHGPQAAAVGAKALPVASRSVARFARWRALGFDVGRGAPARNQGHESTPVRIHLLCFAACFCATRRVFDALHSGCVSSRFARIARRNFARRCLQSVSICCLKPARCG